MSFYAVLVECTSCHSRYLKHVLKQEIKNKPERFLIFCRKCSLQKAVILKIFPNIDFYKQLELESS